jgi:hypothetical protein
MSYINRQDAKHAKKSKKKSEAPDTKELSA